MVDWLGMCPARPGLCYATDFKQCMWAGEWYKWLHDIIFVHIELMMPDLFVILSKQTIIIVQYLNAWTNIQSQYQAVLQAVEEPYSTTVECNGIPCPPYDTQKEVTCVVCTK